LRNKLSDLNSVVISKKPDGSWQAHHVPSGRYAFGETAEEAQDEMRKLLGVNDAGSFDEPLTSDRFDGLAKEIAHFLEGQISEMLRFHSGFARLEAYESGMVHVRLGGGCQGCPSSLFTLANSVRTQLQERFGEEAIQDIVPVH
jgi:Fe-S cluster biogenesis protein NfuA